MKRIVTALAASAAFLVPAIAADLAPPPFEDNRSDPAALVRSLYNAVSRKEYARAWSYFAVPPSKNFAKFVEGYAGTAFAEILAGRPFSEGAAGSVFYKLPVALRAVDSKGEETLFAGCYTLKSVNPQIQEPPFRGLMIEKGALKPADGPWLSTILPEDCDGEKPGEETAEEARARVIAMFRAAHPANCNKLEDSRPFLSGEEPQIFPLKFRYDSDSADQPERLYTLYRFSCAMYAYNLGEAYYLKDDYGEISPVSFAEPDLDIAYADDSSEKVKSMAIGGWRASTLLINSEFDEKSAAITSFSKWRGVGDAFSSGSWEFRNGEFVLKSYAVDASYDGEQTPEEILKLVK